MVEPEFHNSALLSTTDDYPHHAILDVENAVSSDRVAHRFDKPNFLSVFEFRRIHAMKIPRAGPFRTQKMAPRARHDVAEIWMLGW
jgi:hypothetical protein